MQSKHLVTLCLVLAATWAAPAAETIPLAGTWRFALDRLNTGVGEHWFERALSERVSLPGSLPAQGIGDDVTVETRWTGSISDQSYFTEQRFAPYRQPGYVKVPFWLQPDKYYAGAAWYQRDIDIPTAWTGRRVVLTLERPHWQTTVWLDSRQIGSNDSLSTPHVYEFGVGLTAGRHTLTLRVDNSLIVDIGTNSHSITDHTQGNWNGVVGRIELTATAPAWIEDLQIYPHVASRSVTVKGLVGHGAPLGLDATVALVAGPTAVAADSRVVQAAVGPDGRFEAQYPLGAGAETWDEFHPALYMLKATLPNGEYRSVTFGLREIGTEGTQFVLNGRRIFIRGTLECCIFPATGHPPTDVEPWRRIIRVAKSYGLNLFRFHSWCPPEAAFIAGDELGFYFQVEAASWPNESTTLGDGRPVDAWLEAESGRILRAYGNHPSFILMVAGNEPGGNHVNPWLSAWLRRREAEDPRRLFSSASGWPELVENQFHVTPEPRIQHWDQGLASRINARPPETTTDYRDFIAARHVPVVSHEIGQWCVYPNFDEIPKYSGYLKPRNFEIFRDSLAAHHLADQAHAFLLASGRLQTLCYKEEIESALRTPGMGGFELLDLHDFPGQGTALVGVLDPFWEPKGYVTAERYRRFCNHTVPLARLARRVFTTAEALEAEVEVAHFGPAPLAGVVTRWRLETAAGKVVAQGELPRRDIPLGNGTALGHVRADLQAVPAPAQCRLIVGLAATEFENDWDIWVYPAPRASTADVDGVLETSRLDDRALAALDAGGAVLLSIAPDQVKGDARGPVALGFSSIFWNTSWTQGQAPHTLGILCDPRHPALAAFPTEDHSNWQWWYTVSRAGAMILDDLPAELRPIVQVIDDWFTNRRLGLVFEARVGRGRILVSSIDWSRDDNPVTRQLRLSLRRYAAGPQCAPAVTLTAGQIRSLMRP
jgi:Glycosyl hydrolases family 2, sugar binding domain